MVVSSEGQLNFMVNEEPQVNKIYSTSVWGPDPILSPWSCMLLKAQAFLLQKML